MQSYLNLAMKIAAENKTSFQHGAVLVRSGRVIAYAPNVMKNEPKLFSAIYPNELLLQKQSIRKHCSVHAEARVVKLAGERARGSVVYVARVNEQGEPQMSRPCPDCYETMKQAGVKAVVFTSGVEGREYRLTEDIVAQQRDLDVAA